MRIRIVASAAKDLDEGWDFYEAREAGAGEYFMSTLKAEIEGLKFSAGIHPLKYRNYHRALSHVFPFAIYYAKTHDEDVVYAVVILLGFVVALRNETFYLFELECD